jgi:hypothetical protein
MDELFIFFYKQSEIAYCVIAFDDGTFQKLITQRNHIQMLFFIFISSLDNTWFVSVIFLQKKQNHYATTFQAAKTSRSPHGIG